MQNSNIRNSFTFYELQWDTEYFGVSSAKAILYEPLNFKEWETLKKRFKDYQFISIENRDSDPVNAQLIGKDTRAFLADVNIQFKKKLETLNVKPENVEIHQAFNRNEQVINIAEFEFSKFVEDPELAKRGGQHVYKQWVINSFDKPDKYFALYINDKDGIDGFLLYSYKDNYCKVELIAVLKDKKHKGIGTNLFRAVENETVRRGFQEIRVGTQIRNIEAVNFYHKLGCKQVGCHQVYHLWNL